MNHKKIDRMLGLAEQWRLPLVFYAEGGGGRPGDTDRLGAAGLDGPSFVRFAKLSGLVPVIGVVSGYCFAVTPRCRLLRRHHRPKTPRSAWAAAMIEAAASASIAGEVGPVSFQSPNNHHILVEDEAEATAAAQNICRIFRARSPAGADQRLLRRAIPENRLRVYDIRNVIDLLADEGSVKSAAILGRHDHRHRIEGKPFRPDRQQPKHLGGAIDAPAATRPPSCSCDAFGIPILSLYVRRASWSVPAEKTAMCAMSRGCS